MNNPFDWLKQACFSVVQWLINAAIDAYDLPLVGGFIGNLVVRVKDFFQDIFVFAVDASTWYEEVVPKLLAILPWDVIKSNIKEWLPDLTDAIDWFREWWANIKTELGDWWDNTQITVKGWIAIAQKTVETLIDTVSKSLATLQTTWNDFWKTTLPTLITSIDASELIDTALKTWFPFYDDLVKLWDSIQSFFASPLDWLWEQFTDWFLGKE